jgi:hypothetical protein
MSKHQPLWSKTADTPSEDPTRLGCIRQIIFKNDTSLAVRRKGTSLCCHPGPSFRKPTRNSGNDAIPTILRPKYSDQACLAAHSVNALVFLDGAQIVRPRFVREQPRP